MNWSKAVVSTFWLKQKADEPLFPEIDWSRPETKSRGGRLLVIGGNNQSFRRVAQAFDVASKNSVGTIKIAVPDALSKILSNILPDAEYLPSNASGGIGLSAKDELLAYSSWADATLLAGDLGKNSETPQVFHSFVEKYTGLLIIAADSVDVLTHSYDLLLNRSNTLCVLSLAQLQQMFKVTKQTTAITSDIGMVKLTEALHEFTKNNSISITTFYQSQLITAFDGTVVTTPYHWGPDDPSWRVPVAAKQAAFWMQHAEAPFKALATAQLEV